MSTKKISLKDLSTLAKGRLGEWVAGGYFRKNELFGWQLEQVSKKIRNIALQMSDGTCDTHIAKIRTVNYKFITENNLRIDMFLTPEEKITFDSLKTFDFLLLPTSISSELDKIKQGYIGLVCTLHKFAHTYPLFSELRKGVVSYEERPEYPSWAIRDINDINEELIRGSVTVAGDKYERSIYFKNKEKALNHMKLRSLGNLTGVVHERNIRYRFLEKNNIEWGYMNSESNFRVNEEIGEYPYTLPQKIERKYESFFKKSIQESKKYWDDFTQMNKKFQKYLYAIPRYLYDVKVGESKMKKDPFTYDWAKKHHFKIKILRVKLPEKFEVYEEKFIR